MWLVDWRIGRRDKSFVPNKWKAPLRALQSRRGAVLSFGGWPVLRHALSGAAGFVDGLNLRPGQSATVNAQFINCPQEVVGQRVTAGSNGGIVVEPEEVHFIPVGWRGIGDSIHIEHHLSTRFGHGD